MIQKITLWFSVLLFPLTGHALCLQDCATQSTSRNTSFNYQASQQQFTRNNDSFNREKSHNMGDTKNSIVGDVNIRVGHEHMDISGLQNSSNAMINASVTSVVNLGDSGK